MEEPQISSTLCLRSDIGSDRNAACPSRSLDSDFGFDVSDILADYFTKKFDKTLRRGDVDNPNCFKRPANCHREDRRKSGKQKKKGRKKRGRRDCASYDETSLRHREKKPRHEREWSVRDYRSDDDRKHRSHRNRCEDRRRDRSRNPKRDCSRSLTNFDEPLCLDKSELFEVARRNVKQMVHDGTLPKGFSVDPEKLGLFKEQATNSVETYTEMCRQIRKEGENGRSSSQLNHPFIVKDKPIKMNITNSISLPLKTSKKILSAQFPVSSGSTHRELEWYLVTPETPKKKTKKTSELLQNTRGTFTEEQHVKHSTQYDRPKYSESETRQLREGQISRRKQCTRKLRGNPLDTDAREDPKHNDSILNEWRFDSASPGQLTDCVDPSVRFLSANELKHGPQAWTRKDQLKNTKALSGGIGMTLLQKMGWKPGTALGKNREGVLEPLLVDVKFDRKGLVAQEEIVRKQPVCTPNSTANRSAVETAALQKLIEKDFGGKHPVTLILEICTARKLHPPKFIDLPPEGEPHDRTFLCRVDFNGRVFIPTERSLTKKLAKAQAALLALAALRENDASKHW